MKIHVISDLHLSYAPLELPRTDADLVILAGDIARPAQAVAWAGGFEQPVIYVPGNHEYYGGDLAGTRAELARLTAGTRVHVLDETELRLGGVRFLGATLWTDFLLAGHEAQRAEAAAAAARLIADFKRITMDGAQPFTPDASRQLCERAVRWLAQKLAEPDAGPTVVITHHAPSELSVDPRFAGSPLNAAFVSRLDTLVADSAAALWVHGHTHYPVDYRIGGTRVFSNPRGYARNGQPENASFDAHCTLQLGT